MKLTLLGSGSARADAERGAPALLLQAEGSAWWIDAGSGALRQTARCGVDPVALDGVFVTHRHPDHTTDLAALWFAMRAEGRSRDLDVWGGEGLAAFCDGLSAAWGDSVRLRAPAALRVHERSTREPIAWAAGPLQVRSAPAVHSAGALHLRFEHRGRAVVFSGDTGPSDALAVLAEGADLLVCECGRAEGTPPGKHLAPSEVADIVARARPREVWLTHLYPAVDAAQAVEIVARTGVKVRRAADLDTWSGDSAGG